MHRKDIHIRDPFVFVKNGKYYLLGTTGDASWTLGSDLTLYESADLEDFEKKCVMVTDGSLESYTNIWAPELHEYKGKYYLILSVYREDLGRGSMIYVSESLEKPFTPLMGEYITPLGWECLDATLYVWENKPYLCFSNGWTNPVERDGDGALFIVALSDDLTRMVEEPRKIISGKRSGIAIEISGGGAKGYLAEGPYMYSENDTIVLLWSTISETGYTVVKSVSKSGIYGPYETEQIIFDNDGGHCMSFLALDGKRKMTLHQPNVAPNERMQVLDL